MLSGCIWFAWLLPCSVQEQVRPVVCLCVAWTTWIIVVVAKAQDACWGWCNVFLSGLLVPCSPRFSRLAAEDRLYTDSFAGSFAWLGASSCNFLINNQPLCPFILNLCPCLTLFTMGSMGSRQKPWYPCWSPGGRQEHRGLWDLLRDSVLTWQIGIQPFWCNKLNRPISCRLYRCPYSYCELMLVAFSCPISVTPPFSMTPGMFLSSAQGFANVLHLSLHRPKVQPSWRNAGDLRQGFALHAAIRGQETDLCPATSFECVWGLGTLTYLDNLWSRGEIAVQNAT